MYVGGLSLDSSTVHDASLLVVRWHLILDVAYQRYSDFCRIIPSQDVRDKVSFDLHLHLNTQHSVVLFLWEVAQSIAIIASKMPIWTTDLPFLVLL